MKVKDNKIYLKANTDKCEFVTGDNRLEEQIGRVCLILSARNKNLKLKDIKQGFEGLDFVNNKITIRFRFIKKIR